MTRKFAVAAVIVACAMTLISLAYAEPAKPESSKKISPAGIHVVKPAVLRTPEQMDAFEATYVAPEEREEPEPRPTIDPVLYKQLKHLADITPKGIRPNANVSPAPEAKVVTKFGGASYCDVVFDGECWFPPDVSGAIGKTQFVSVSNDEIEIRSRTGTLQKMQSLNAFVGYSTEAIYDPRVQYDPIWQRWIVTCLGFPEGSDATTQYLFIAVSQTNSATGSWWIYSDNVNGFGGTGSLYDFDMLGQSQDALIFTANIFGATEFDGSSLFTVAKALLYNGFGWDVPYWIGLESTLQPADQLEGDGNGYAWLAAAPTSSSEIYMYAVASPSNPDNTAFYGPYTVSGVPGYSVPPSAAQPSSCANGATLATGDNRFQNVGIQNGDTFYQTHTFNDSGYPTPRYYVITGLLSFNPTVSVTNYFYTTGSSNDWEPSIAADPAGHFALTYSSTDPGNGVLPSMRYVDNNGGDPFGPGVGINVYTSASCYNTGTPYRWGDYSSTTLDPGTGSVSSTGTKTFWIDNETTPSLNDWSTEIAKITY